MMRRSLATVAITVMAGTAMGADYFFPTAYPQGVDLDTVKQIVTFIWDDNAYSGLDMTDYELHPDEQPNNTDFANHQWVGGKKPWGAAADNKLNIQEGDMGMAWAITKLAGAENLLPPKYDANKEQYNAQSGQVVHNDSVWSATGWIGRGTEPTLDPSYPEKNGGHYQHHWKFEGTVAEMLQNNLTKTNPDGSPIHFTFNVISGLFVPIIGAQDGQRVSKFGYWQPNDVDLVEFPHLDAYKSGKLPIAWGREMPVKSDFDAEGNVNGEAYGRINDVFLMTKEFGHEIGNHTIDHLESNSMLPNAKGSFPAGTNGEWYRDGFAAWGGAGFAADHISPKNWGDYNEEVSEVEEFGRRQGITWHYMGWELYAGKTLPYAAWKGLIELGEEDLEIELGMKPIREGGKIGAFRAPRLEVNGAMHYALADLGYQYDCGQEEGYEYHIDGTNFYWPYTTDNGTPNVSWQRSIGEQMTIDSMPNGFWQVPVNAMIVPEEIREEVWANYEIIAKAEGNDSHVDAVAKEHWINNSGRITGFDFNMFILWGMTRETALKTLKYNLDQRMAGGKAPMQVGSHTDYFTPIYDNATLLSETNRATYGLCVDKGWNNWEDRKAVFSDFIDYGLSKGAYFWSGAQTVDYVRKIAEAGKKSLGTKETLNASWNFYDNSGLNSSASTESVTGDFNNVTINVAKEDGDVFPDAGFVTTFNAGDLAGLDHISLDYKTNTPLAIKLITPSGEADWEVWLNNLNRDVNSGNIPLTAFHYNQYEDTKQPARTFVDPAKVVAIEIAPIVHTAKENTVNFTVKNFSVYKGGDATSIDNKANVANKEFVSIQGVINNALQLNVPTAGVYSVDIVTLDGRIVKSVKAADFKAGVNSVDLGSLGRGLYLVNINNGQLRRTLKATVL